MRRLAWEKLLNRSLLLSLLLVMPLTAAASVVPKRLRCEYQVNPLGLGVEVPRLSWVLEGDRRGERQTAYRVLVASDPAVLKRGEGDLWDSGRVASDQTAHVEYGGKPLRSGQRVYWTVTTWDRDGASKTSAPAHWEMGLLNRSDWSANWIGVPMDPSPKGDVAWIWTSEATREGAPKGTRVLRTSFEVAGAVKSAVLGLAVDNRFEATLNGKAISRGDGWQAYTRFDLKDALRPGRNELVVRATNDDGPAGLAALGQIVYADGRTQTLTSSTSWEASVDGQRWEPAKAWAKMGDQPYRLIKWNGQATPPPHLRRTFDVPRQVRRARAYVSARGLYKLFVDGKSVGNAIFAPGWTDYRKRIQYQTYDITPYLKPGRHAVGMVLGDGWYCGHVGLTGRNNYGERPQGLAQIEIEYTDGTKDRIVSDGTWQASTGAILTSDLLMGEDYDARKELGSWSAPNYSGGTWRPVDSEPIGPVPLVAQYAPTVQRIVELKPKKITEPKPGTYVLDLGQNMVGWARLRVKGEAGRTVKMRFAEILNPDGTIYTTNLRGARATENYTLKGGGSEVYEPSFTFHGFRYVELTNFPGKPSLDNVTGVVVSSATPKSGEFASSDPLVNQLQSNIEWGQRGNYLEVPTDCPQRDERLGWMADAQIFARTAMFNADISAFMTKWMQDVIDAQSPEGGFPDVAPRIGAEGDGAPAWGDAGVIVPWAMYRMYGDRRLLAQSYDAMTKWIGYVDRANPDHIWSKRMNANYGDWLNHNADLPRDVLATAYFAYSTDLVARSARVLGKTADAAKYEALRDAIKQAFNDRFVAADGTIKGDTQTAYVIALQFDLLPESKRANAAKRLVDDILLKRNGHLSTGFVGVGYLNPTLTAIGRPDVAYRLLLNDTYPSWGYSIRQGATTIWERWDGWTKEKGFQDPGMNSFNHYSLGSVGEWMYSTVGGVDIDAPSRRFVVRPIPGGNMRWARASYDSLYGKVASAWRMNGDTLELDVTVPTNTTATIYVPAASADAVREGQGAAAQADGVKFLRMEGGAAVYAVGGGSYRFRSRTR